MASDNHQRHLPIVPWKFTPPLWSLTAQSIPYMMAWWRSGTLLQLLSLSANGLTTLSLSCGYGYLLLFTVLFCPSNCCCLQCWKMNQVCFEPPYRQASHQWNTNLNGPFTVVCPQSKPESGAKSMCFMYFLHLQYSCMITSSCQAKEIQSCCYLTFGAWAWSPGVFYRFRKGGLSNIVVKHRPLPLVPFIVDFNHTLISNGFPTFQCWPLI